MNKGVPFRGLALMAGLLFLIVASVGPVAGNWQDRLQVTSGERVHGLLLDMAAKSPQLRVPVIVMLNGEANAPEQAVSRLGGRITQNWTVVNGFAAEIPVGRLPQLAMAPGVRWISPDSPVRPQTTKEGVKAIEETTATVDAKLLQSVYPFAAKVDKVWNDGITGKGVTVAVIDTGVSEASAAGNYDLNGRVAASVSVHPNATTPADRHGHGTHVAGIVAGDGATLGGSYVGIAPGARIVSVRVSDDTGAATESSMISGLNWVADHQAAYGIRVVNISATSSLAQSYQNCPLCAAVEAVWNRGIVVVTAAGNLGTVADAVSYPPANDPYVITVGALWDKGTKSVDDDVMATWSSRGRTQDGFVKPEVLAPGSRIVSMGAGPGSDLAQRYPENVVSQNYFMLGGTSMSAPVVSGVVALMLQRDPTLTPDQVKWILMNTGRVWGGQTATDPKTVAADYAVGYTKNNQPGVANRNLTPSASAYPTGDPSMDPDAVYWTAVHWAAVHWAFSPTK